MMIACAAATSSQCSEYHLCEGKQAFVVPHFLAGGRPGSVLGICCVLAVMHSLLASRQAKQLVEAMLGERVRVGGYRFAFIVQSAVCFVGLTVWFLRQPDRELYRVPPPWSWLMRLGQVASLGLGFSAVRLLGMDTFNGLPQVRALVGGQQPQPEPEAQGPPLASDREMVVEGPYRYLRHPNNLAPLGVLALFPRMTVNRAALVLATAAYAVLGSLHEEYRLRAAYGDAYRRYQDRVPFLLPRL
jgi:hypothetical protein